MSASETCNCGKPATKTGVVNGAYGNYCNDHWPTLVKNNAAYLREESYQNHKADVVQPWRNGEANPEFAEIYKDRVDDYYTEEEKQNLERDY